MKNLLDLFLNQLADAYYAEKQIAKALPAIARAATHESLRSVLEDHGNETEHHARMVESVFQSFGESPESKKCHAIIGILTEVDEMIAEYDDSPALDAAIIAAVQKVEHYEITTYGSLLEWATQLDNLKAVTALETILEEEKAADVGLTKLAREVINESAEVVSGSHDPDSVEPPEPSSRSRSTNR